jgi:hypothetical protein
MKKSSSDAIGLWPGRPVEAAGESRDFARLLFPSGRQALERASVLGGGTRHDHIAIPEYVGHCVISTLGKHITPVPFPFARHAASEVSQVLLYSQWGWERGPESLDEVSATFPGAVIILDRVDSCCESVRGLPALWADEDAYQVFSLSKTAGVRGGLLFTDGEWVIPERSRQEEKLGERFEAVESYILGNMQFENKVAHWRMFEDRSLGSEVIHWLGRNNLDDTIRSVWEARSEKLKLTVDRAPQIDWPAWMRRQLLGDMKVSPGIIPIPCESRSKAEAKVADIRARFNVNLEVYHFDWSPSFLQPDWRLCVAVPLHPEVSSDTYLRILNRAADL